MGYTVTSFSSSTAVPTSEFTPHYNTTPATVSFLPDSSRLDDLTRFQRILAHSVKLHSHLEILIWLQGDIQRYLPHDILIAAWGNFRTGQIQHDIISVVSGVRSNMANGNFVTPLLLRLFAQWLESGKEALVHDASTLDRLLPTNAKDHVLVDALRGMRCALTHGIKDTRGSHDCLYVMLTGYENFDLVARNTLTQVLPYIDHALRQVEHLPHQSLNPGSDTPQSALHHRLTPQQREILHWIATGKTNGEIGSILGLSIYTVKNHVQRILKKMNVSNRAQAVAVLTNHA